MSFLSTKGISFISALGKALNDVGDYARAFGHFLQGNNLKRQEIAWDEATDIRQFEMIRDKFSVDTFSRFHNTGTPSSAPVFILGMPRSGSTLVEQILASHPQVYGAGELDILNRVANNSVSDANGRCVPYPVYVSALNATDCNRFGQSYIQNLPRLPEGRTRITDKMPINFLYVGLIKLLLPNAKIIHTMRDPIDTCLSCFSTCFGTSQHFTYDMAELGRYYRRYSTLMDHWRAILPSGAMLDCSYEELVDNFEGQARRLIAYCGLPWDDRCLCFYKTERTVSTASKVQVRQPLFRSSLQRWRRYEPYLGPLFAELGLPSVP